MKILILHISETKKRNCLPSAHQINNFIPDNFYFCIWLIIFQHGIRKKENFKCVSKENQKIFLSEIVSPGREKNKQLRNSHILLCANKIKTWKTFISIIFFAKNTYNSTFNI